MESGTGPGVAPAGRTLSHRTIPLSTIFLIVRFWHNSICLFNAAYWTFMFAALGAVGAKLRIRTGVAVTIIALMSAAYFLVEKPVNNLASVKWFAIIVFLETALVFIQGFLGGWLVYKYHFAIKPRHRQATWKVAGLGLTSTSARAFQGATNRTLMALK